MSVPKWATKKNNKSRNVTVQIEEAIDDGPPPDIHKRKLICDSLSLVNDHLDLEPHKRKKDDVTGGTYLYCWGSGHSGQLGHYIPRGHAKCYYKPKFVALPARVHQIDCNASCSACVTDDGQLYMWGKGAGFKFQPIPKLHEAFLDIQILKVSVGPYHSCVIDVDGSIWSWGSSRFGQTGLGTTKYEVKDPQRIITEDNLKFVTVSCGHNHTAALTEDGYVYTWGSGEHGQLGHGTVHDHESGVSRCMDRPRPCLVKFLEGEVIVDVKCGSEYTAMLTEKGDLYICGFGEFIFSEKENFFDIPHKVEFSKKISSFSCGRTYVLILTEHGNVYSWGNNKYGQLGHGTHINSRKPKLILNSGDIVRVCAGRYHAFAINKYGIVFGWGFNDHGQCCIDGETCLVPKPIENLQNLVVAEIVCGDHHSMAITSVYCSQTAKTVDDFFKRLNVEFKLKTTRLLSKKKGCLTAKDFKKIKTQMDAM